MSEAAQTVPASTLPPEQPLLPTRPAQGRALLLVLAVVAGLAALSLLFARGADRLERSWSAQLSETSTVQVMVPSETLREAQLSEAQAILRRAVPDGEITALSRAESLALIQPWLGDADLPDDLPVPGVITVRASTKLPADSLQRSFAAANIRASIDDHSRFSGRLQQSVGRLVLLGAGLVALTLLAGAAVSVFATRAGLAAQRDIIHVLVQAGASDSFIARLFVRQNAIWGALGASFGAGAAVLLWLYVSFGPGRGSVGWQGLDVLGDALALALLVGAFGAACALAAGWAASRQLAEERRRA